MFVCQCLGSNLIIWPLSLRNPLHDFLRLISNVWNRKPTWVSSVHWCTVRRFCCWEGQRWDSKQAVKLRVSALSLMLSLRRRAIGPSALHIWKIVFSLAKCLRERGSFGSWILSCLLNFLRCKFFKLLKTITSQSQCSVRRPPLCCGQSWCLH